MERSGINEIIARAFGCKQMRNLPLNAMAFGVELGVELLEGGSLRGLLMLLETLLDGLLVARGKQIDDCTGLIFNELRTRSVVAKSWRARPRLSYCASKGARSASFMLFIACTSKRMSSSATPWSFRFRILSAKART